MQSSQLLDSLSIAGVFVVFAIITMACYEGGFRVGRWWQEREPGEQKSDQENSEKATRRAAGHPARLQIEAGEQV